MSRRISPGIRWLAGVAILGLLVGVGSFKAGAQQAAPKLGTMNAEQEKGVVTQYCAGCHNARIKSGSLGVENVDFSKTAQNAEILEKVVHKVRAGMMPPSGLKRPEPAELENWLQSLERDLDKGAVPVLPPPGLHRLNRTEYSNVI